MEINVVDYIDYIQYNSVVTLTMFFISLVVVGLNYITKGKANKYIFSTERKSLLKPMTYIRFFTHILGHRDWKHFSNNYMKILLLGPLVEEKYGSITFLIMILVTALITGIVNYIKGDSRLRGASNIVFMLIVLSAFVNITANKIPLTLILVILFYIIDEIKDMKKDDNIAHYGHLTGAICGGIFGFLYINPSTSNFFIELTSKIEALIL